MSELSTPNGYKVGSNLEKVLRAKAFAVTAELGPPKSADVNIISKKAKLLKGNCDAVNITDNQTAVVRMSSIGAGFLAMQADLLGAYALGLRNLLCLSGDHQSMGNHPTSKNVYDIDSMQLIQMMAEMRDKCTFQCGEAIKEAAPKFFIGAAENPFGDPFEFRPYRLGKKIKAGADFIQTQGIFNVQRFREFMQRCGDLGLLDKVYVLAGVIPVKGAAGAKYMRDSVPGMDVPNEVVQRFEAAAKGIEDKKARAEATQKVGIDLTVEIIQQVREIPGVAGVHIMAVEWEAAVKTIAEKAGLLPRPVIKVEQVPAIQAA